MRAAVLAAWTAGILAAAAIAVPPAAAQVGDSTCAPPSPNTGLTDMGFESGAFAPNWTLGTVVDEAVVTGADDYTSPNNGAFMARLGAPGFTGQAIGRNEICQDFIVDEPTEMFVYNIFTHDYTGFDDFQFQVQVTSNGDLIAAYQQEAWGEGTELKTTGWTGVELDLSGHVGQTVRITFSAGGTFDDLYRFWAYVDDGTAPPPAAPLAGATSATGSVMTDPTTGQVTVAQPFGNKSDLTVTTTPACPPGTTVESVTLLLDGQPYAMTDPDGDGTYTGTILADELQSGDLAIQVVCSGQTFVNTVGTVQLYDPSGIVTDASTGLPIVGAAVTLFHVPGWSPGLGGEAASQCQNDGPPWTQPAPTGVGVEVNPLFNPNIEPDVNPFVTNAIGYYGWDVAEGCWYVVVSKDGYETLTSPVVGVPPPVTTLDLELTPTSGDADTTAPVITTPADMTVDATSRNGAIVNYPAASAVDDVDGAVAVDCAPASGSQFALGTTTVECTATDAAGNPANASFEVTVLTFREQLLALREQLAALVLEGQADVRRDSSVEFLDRALAAAAWDVDGSPATNDAGMNALRAGRSGYNYMRTPNAVLSAASATIQLGMVELYGRIAHARFDEVSGTPGASASRLVQAQTNLDNAAAQPGTPEALLQYLKAWEVLKNEPPQFPSAPAA